MPRKFPSDRKQRNLVVLAIQKAIDKTFNESDWKELGYRTGIDDWIERHPRLLRSLSWGDPDYGGHVLDAIEHVLEIDAANLDVLLAHPLIAKWLSENDPAALAAVGVGAAVAVPVPILTTSSEAVERALRDAEALINSTGPSSAVDRVHTALHAYMIATCDTAGIPYNPDPGITELLKLMRKHHPGLQSIGAQSANVLQILQGFASIVHVLNELRNRASGAHPNAEVLGPDEAMLVINGTRTLFGYLNAKIR